MTEVPQLGSPPERLTVTEQQVRRLVAEQLPQWAGLQVRAVADGGWDNWTFHLGPQLSVRLPSAAAYAEAVGKEQRWLPELGPQLPLPIPDVVAKGRPGAGYPFPWSVHRWLQGEPAFPDRIASPVRFAAELAGFLVALQDLSTAGGPPPGLHNWYRGGTLRTYDETVQHALEALSGRVDAGLARQVWAAALDARWDGVPRWFHGDVAAGNLLLRDGELAAVIDFGTCGVGDPSCDLAVAWTLLTAEGRQVLRERMAVDDGAWSRGRGWALWQALAACARTADGPDRSGAAARLVLDAVLDDVRAGAAGR